MTYDYSEFMDLLVGSAPRNVALALGTIKIILLILINHQEFKKKVKEYMKNIKLKLEMVDHLTTYRPNPNLVNLVAKAYEIFSRLLCSQAGQYYSMKEFSKYVGKPQDLTRPI